MERTLDKFIDQLLKEQEYVDTSDMRAAANAFYGDKATDHYIRTHLLSREDYEEILKPTWDFIQTHKDYTPDEIREGLFRKSEIQLLVNEFVFGEQQTPGLVLSYGTGSYEDIIICGKKDDSECSTIGEYATKKQNPESMKEDTIFDIASNTKLFTAICVLKLISSGEISLSDEVTKLDPRFVNLKGVTIEQLLSFNVPLKTPNRIDEAKDREEAEKLLFATEINAKAKEFDKKYNDIHAMILKYVVQTVTGNTNETFMNYVKETILTPLGMNDTSVVVPEDKLNRVSSTDLCYESRQIDDRETKERLIRTPLGEVFDPKARKMGQKDGILSGHAGLFSTVPDLTKLAKNLTVKDVVLSEDALALFYTNATGRPYIDIKTGKKKYLQYHGRGLNFVKNPERGDSEIPHTASGKAFASNGWTGMYFMADPVTHSHIVLGGNKANGRLGMQIGDLPAYKIDNGASRMLNLPESRYKSYRPDFGLSVPISARYAWTRDKIVDKANTLLIQYRMIDYAMPDAKLEKSEPKRYMNV